MIGAPVASLRRARLAVIPTAGAAVGIAIRAGIMVGARWTGDFDDAAGVRSADALLHGRWLGDFADRGVARSGARGASNGAGEPAGGAPGCPSW